jgi:hypothetical protein
LIHHQLVKKLLNDRDHPFPQVIQKFATLNKIAAGVKVWQGGASGNNFDVTRFPRLRRPPRFDSRTLAARHQTEGGSLAPPEKVS